MSFDARSRERLEALGRRLPTALPLPAAPSPAEAAGPAGRPLQGRHRLEQEQDPEQLFRELMAASPDGSVPPHHLERLRQLEQRRQGAANPAGVSGPERQAAEAANQPSGRRPAPRPAAGSPLQRRQSRQSRPLDPEQQQAYTAFQQLLLEGDD